MNKQEILISRGVVSDYNSITGQVEVILNDDNMGATSNVVIRPVLLHASNSFTTGELSGHFPTRGDYCMCLVTYNIVMRGNLAIPLLTNSFLLGYYTPMSILGTYNPTGTGVPMQEGSFSIRKGTSDLHITKSGDLSFIDKTLRFILSPSKFLTYMSSLRFNHTTANFDEINDFKEPDDINSKDPVCHTKIFYRSFLPISLKTWDKAKKTYRPTTNDDYIEYRVGSIPESLFLESKSIKHFDANYLYEAFINNADKNSNYFSTAVYSQRSLESASYKLYDEIKRYTANTDMIETRLLDKLDKLQLEEVLKDDSKSIRINYNNGLEVLEVFSNTGASLTVSKSGKTFSQKIDFDNESFELEVNGELVLEVDFDGVVKVRSQDFKKMMKWLTNHDHGPTLAITVPGPPAKAGIYGVTNILDIETEYL